MELWRDVLSTREDLSGLRDIRNNERDGAALLVALTDSPYEIKLLSMFGLFLQTEGLPTELLLSSSHTSRSRKYAAAFGIDDVTYLDDLVQGRSTSESLVIQAIEAARESPTAFRQYSIKGWWAGPQVLSRLLTPDQPTISALDMGDSNVVAVVKDIASRFDAVKDWLTDRSFQLAICIEANGPLHGPVIDALIESRCPVIQATQPLQSSQILLKRFSRANRRHHPSSVAPETLEEFSIQELTADDDALLHSTLRERYSLGQTLFAGKLDLQLDLTRNEFCRHFQLDKAKPIVVVFPHILWDANLFYGHDLFDDYSSWLVQTVRVLRKLNHINVLIKLHPANQWKYQGPHASAESRLLLDHNLIPDPNMRLVPPDTSVSTWCFLQHADYGITVRGSIGFEMPCFGKPVLTAGTGRYSNLGFTVDSDSQVDYLRKVETIDTISPLTTEQTTLARKHAFLATVRRPWKMSSFRTIESPRAHPGHPLRRNLKATISVREFDQAGDVRLWLDWALGATSADYLGAGHG